MFRVWLYLIVSLAYIRKKYIQAQRRFIYFNSEYDDEYDDDDDDDFFQFVHAHQEQLIYTCNYVTEGHWQLNAWNCEGALRSTAVLPGKGFFG